MILSHETRRIRWSILLAAWLLAVTYLFINTKIVGDYLALTYRMGLRDSPAPTTALTRTYPAFGADAQVWVRHALALLEGHDVRLRYTTIDNAPYGREVHWNSAWAWTIAGAGWLHHTLSGLPLEQSVELATLWLNPLILTILALVFAIWATQRAGLLLGLLVLASMVTSNRIHEGFFPTYVDHHGLLTVSVFGLALGAVLMGCGYWQPRDPTTPGVLPTSPEAAQTAAVFSALWGAFGLWVSAASVIPPIALVGISGLLAVLIQGKATVQQGAKFDPQTWRLWGRTGAVASLAFYLIEYFPQHLSFRLEPNHPLHAIAWLGGAELIAQLSERWLAPRHQRWARLERLIWPAAAVSLAPAVIIIGGTRVFSILDPFMSRLHNDYIQEFLPLWRTLQTFNTTSIIQTVVIGNLPLLAALATISYRRRTTPIVLSFALIATLFLTLMATWQSRWLLNSTGVQLALGLVVLSTWLCEWRPIRRWQMALALVAVLMVPEAVLRSKDLYRQVISKQVSPADALAALNRDIAATLRASQPKGEMIVLASPNASTGVGYYGRFKTLGTLYWENAAGLKAAAAILGARSEAEAATLVRTHKITHIALISQENFIEQYYQLLHPEAKVDEIRQCFGLRIMIDKVVPQWLQMIPYKIPDDLASLKPIVMLFKVNFSQTRPEAMYNVALAQIASGAAEAGEETLNQLLQITPQAPEPWLRKAELLFTRRSWPEATEHFLKGISLSPPQSRPALYNAAAANLYSQQQHALAARIYRVALTEQPTAQTVSYLGWILASSPDDTLRNPKEALELAQLAVKADPASPSFLSVLSAALAENGRLPEAITAANQAVANSALRKDTPDIQQEFARRLEALKAGQPLRSPLPATPPPVPVSR